MTLTLVKLGYVGTDKKTFWLRSRILELGYSYLSSQPWWQVAQPVLEEAARATQEWQAVPCPLAEAHFLEIDPGTPVLRIEQTTFDAEGRPFEHLESYFRGDKFILVAELRNGGRMQRNGAPA